MTRRDELVEEIAEELADYYVEEDGIGLAFVIPHGQHWPLLRRIIALTLKAVADGKLELPGEKWRQQYGPKEVIIALRPTGTGKKK